MEKVRDSWASKLGVILAVAGSAIGLGNFLRFPVKAATFGGGAFLIPYFVALVLLGIPLAWVEWTMGRYGGRYGHGSGPGILNAVVRKPWAKYLGSIGVFGPLLIFFYYVYIESWLLGFCFYSLTGELGRAVAAGQVSAFFGNYITLKTMVFGAFPAALFFFLITFAVNFTVIYLGIRKGIEILNKVALPILFVLGIMLFVRVLTVPGIEKGLGYMWNPDFSKLLNFRVWLEATGQIFFTLSVGIGAILTYASYIKKKQDVALSSLSACSANTFAEVILGGTIVIPLAIVVYGATNIQQVATMGTFGLSFNTMPVIFGKLPLGDIFQFVWFFLLFLAGLTSSISVLQPGISFFEDEVGLSKNKSVTIVGIFSLIMGLIAVFGLTSGAVDEMDFWGGTFALVLFGAVEAIIFAWIFGMKRGWEELNTGAEIKVPKIFRFILQFITPVYLIVLLTGWMVTEGWKVITLSDMVRHRVAVQETVGGQVKNRLVTLQQLNRLRDSGKPGLNLSYETAGATNEKIVKTISLSDWKAMAGNVDAQSNIVPQKVTILERTGGGQSNVVVSLAELSKMTDGVMVDFLGLKMVNTTFIFILRSILVALLLAVNVVIFVAWRRRRLDDRLNAAKE